MNILILGSNSFVGKKIYEKFQIKKNLKVFTIKEHFNENDIDNLSNIDFYKKYFFNFKVKFDCIINLIHIHKNFFDEEVYANINLAEKIIYFQNINKSKIVYLSSVNCSKSVDNKYSYSKYMVEKKFIKTNNYQIIRPSTVVLEDEGQYIGGRNGSSLKIINFFIKYFFFFPIINNGKFLHTICFLEDLQKFIYISITLNLFKNQTINFFSGEYLNFKKFILFLANKQKKKVNFVNVPFSLLIFFIKILKFAPIFKINVQMFENLISQRIEFDLTLEISKYLNLKKAE